MFEALAGAVIALAVREVAVALREALRVRQADFLALQSRVDDLAPAADLGRRVDTLEDRIVRLEMVTKVRPMGKA